MISRQTVDLPKTIDYYLSQIGSSNQDIQLPAITAFRVLAERVQFSPDEIPPQFYSSLTEVAFGNYVLLIKNEILSFLEFFITKFPWAGLIFQHLTKFGDLCLTELKKSSNPYYAYILDAIYSQTQELFTEFVFTKHYLDFLINLENAPGLDWAMTSLQQICFSPYFVDSAKVRKIVDIAHHAIHTKIITPASIGFSILSFVISLDDFKILSSTEYVKEILSLITEPPPNDIMLSIIEYATNCIVINDQCSKEICNSTITNYFINSFPEFPGELQYAGMVLLGNCIAADAPTAEFLPIVPHLLTVMPTSKQFVKNEIIKLLSMFVMLFDLDTLKSRLNLEELIEEIFGFLGSDEEDGIIRVLSIFGNLLSKEELNEAKSKTVLSFLANPNQQQAFSDLCSSENAKIAEMASVIYQMIPIEEQ